MLKELLNEWKGEIDINDKHYTNVEHAMNDFTTLSDIKHIVLHSKSKSAVKTKIERIESKSEYRIVVKKYMTQTATPSFDFMAKWNHNIPMPLRTMTGTVEKETRGMVYMKLHGKGEQEIRCMRCGRTLTNPISKHYGIGPECMSKLGLVCDINDVETIKEKLVDITWEGWIIKSAIVEKEEL